MPSMQTRAMIAAAGENMCATVARHKETGKFHGVLYVNHPTPSGSDRWMPALSDKRGWDDEKAAAEAFDALLAAEGIEVKCNG